MTFDNHSRSARKSSGTSISSAKKDAQSRLAWGGRQVVALLVDAIVFHASGTALSEKSRLCRPVGGGKWDEARPTDLNFRRPAPIKPC